MGFPSASDVGAAGLDERVVLDPRGAAAGQRLGEEPRADLDAAER
ncbi:MAG: hypothetical protein AAFU73_02755 [Planctomycetota bacterium]